MKHRFSAKVGPTKSIVFFGCLRPPPFSQRAAQGGQYASAFRSTAYQSYQTSRVLFQETAASISKAGPH